MKREEFENPIEGGGGWYLESKKAPYKYLHQNGQVKTCSGSMYFKTEAQLLNTMRSYFSPKIYEFEMPVFGEVGWYIATKYAPFFYLRANGAVGCYKAEGSVYFKTEKEADEARTKYMMENRVMKKEDLKDGMIVKMSDGKLRIVLAGSLMGICGTTGGMALHYVNNDLTTSQAVANDIVAVFTGVYAEKKGYIGSSVGWFDRTGSAEIMDNVTCLWTRPEPIEMTLSEVCELLGKDIKIVKG